MTKTYLGDGAYALLDDAGDLVLTTEDGVRETNRVVLDPALWCTLLDYLESKGWG